MSIRWAPAGKGKGQGSQRDWRRLAPKSLGLGRPAAPSRCHKLTAQNSHYDVPERHNPEFSCLVAAANSAPPHNSLSHVVAVSSAVAWHPQTTGRNTNAFHNTPRLSHKSLVYITMLGESKLCSVVVHWMLREPKKYHFCVFLLSRRRHSRRRHAHPHPHHHSTTPGWPACAACRPRAILLAQSTCSAHTVPEGAVSDLIPTITPTKLPKLTSSFPIMGVSSISRRNAGVTCPGTMAPRA